MDDYNTPYVSDDRRSRGTVSLLNNNFEDIRSNLYGNSYQMVYKEPNTTMNDYTKNISSPIFMPGVYRQSATLTTQANKFVSTEYRTRNLK